MQSVEKSPRTRKKHVSYCSDNIRVKGPRLSEKKVVTVRETFLPPSMSLVEYYKRESAPEGNTFEVDSDCEVSFSEIMLIIFFAYGIFILAAHMTTILKLLLRYDIAILSPGHKDGFQICFNKLVSYVLPLSQSETLGLSRQWVRFLRRASISNIMKASSGNFGRYGRRSR